MTSGICRDNRGAGQPGKRLGDLGRRVEAAYPRSGPLHTSARVPPIRFTPVDPATPSKSRAKRRQVMLGALR